MTAWANSTLPLTDERVRDVLTAETVGRTVHPLSADETAAGIVDSDIDDWTQVPGNVLRYGYTGSGDETAVLQMAIDAVGNGGQVLLPVSAIQISSIDLASNVELIGLGRRSTKITVTGNGVDSETAALYGIRCRGLVADGLSGVVRLQGFEVELTTATANVHGLLIRRKTIATDVYVHSATGDGIRFDTNVANNAPFFGRMIDVWSKNNGGYGCNLRKGANSNVFINCLFDSNGLDGFIQQVDGIATNGNVVIGGQASFNALRGYNIDSGTNFQLSGCYGEFNGANVPGEADWVTATNYAIGDIVTSPASGLTSAQTSVIYVCTEAHLADAAFDVDYNAGRWAPYGSELRVGDPATFSSIAMGLILSNKTDRVRNEATQTSTVVSVGGKRIGALYDDVRISVGGGGEASVYFSEGGVDVFRIRYNGAPASPTNELTLETANAGVWTEVLTLTNNGRLSFFGAATQAQPDVAGSRGGNAALGSLITALANLGLITDSTT